MEIHLAYTRSKRRRTYHTILDLDGGKVLAAGGERPAQTHGG